MTILPACGLKLLIYKIQKENRRNQYVEVILNKSNIQTCNGDELKSKHQNCKICLVAVRTGPALEVRYNNTYYCLQVVVSVALTCSFHRCAVKLIRTTPRRLPLNSTHCRHLHSWLSDSVTERKKTAARNTKERQGDRKMCAVQLFTASRLASDRAGFR